MYKPILVESGSEEEDEYAENEFEKDEPYQPAEAS